MAKGERVGEVIHFFNKISVAVLRLTKPLKVGDTVHFLGRNTDFQQTISSMEVDHEPVAEGGKGSEVAIKVQQRVRRGDSIFRIEEET